MNPLQKLANRVLKSAIGKVAKRTTVGRAVAKAAEPARSAVQMAKKASDVVEHGVNIAPKPIDVTPSVPTTADLLKRIKSLEKENAELKKENAELKSNRYVQKKIDFEYSYDFYYEKQRDLYWQSIAEGVTRQTAKYRIITMLERHQSEIEERKLNDDKTDSNYTTAIELALERIQRLINEINEAFKAGYKAVTEFEGDTP